MHVKYLTTRHSRLSSILAIIIWGVLATHSFLFSLTNRTFSFPIYLVTENIFLTDNSQSNHSGNEYGSLWCCHIYLITNVINILKWLKLSLTIFYKQLFFDHFLFSGILHSNISFNFCEGFCEVLLSVFKWANWHIDSLRNLLKVTSLEVEDSGSESKPTGLQALTPATRSGVSKPFFCKG